MSQSRTSTDMLWKDPENKEASLIFYFESGPWHWHIEDLYILIKCSSNATSSSCWRSPLKLLGDTLLWNPLAMSRWVRRGGTQKKTWNGKYFCSQLSGLQFPFWEQYLTCKIWKFAHHFAVAFYLIQTLFFILFNSFNYFISFSKSKGTSTTL